MDPILAFGVAGCVAQFVKLSFSVFHGLSRYIQAVKQAPKRSSELHREVLLVCLVLKELKSILDHSNEEGLPTTLHDTVVEFWESMRDMESRLLVKDSELTKRVKWPFREKENKKYLSKLERYKHTFILALTTIQRYILYLIENLSNCQYSQRLLQIDSITQDIHNMSLGHLDPSFYLNADLYRFDTDRI